MTKTTRTIQQILAIRLRAAELRVMECALVVLKATEDLNLTKALESKRLADEGVVLVQREIDGQRVPYDAPSTFATQRYAAVLMLDNPEMTREQAMDAAAADESTRFEDWYARYGEFKD